MEAMLSEHTRPASSLERELSNFRSMMEYVNWIPDEVSLANIEVFGQTFPLNGILGMILAIPLTAFLVVFWRLVKEKYIQEWV